MKLNLPVILLKGTVLMPFNEIKLEFEDETSKSIIDESELFHNNKLFVVTVPSLEEEISIKSLPKIGIIAHITRKLLLPNGKVRISLKGLKRGLVIEYLNRNIPSFPLPNSEIKSIFLRLSKKTLISPFYCFNF